MNKTYAAAAHVGSYDQGAGGQALSKQDPTVTGRLRAIASQLALADSHASVIAGQLFGMGESGDPVAEAPGCINHLIADLEGRAERLSKRLISISTEL